MEYLKAVLVASILFTVHSSLLAHMDPEYDPDELLVEEKYWDAEALVEMQRTISSLGYQVSVQYYGNYENLGMKQNWEFYAARQHQFRELTKAFQLHAANRSGTGYRRPLRILVGVHPLWTACRAFQSRNDPVPSLLVLFNVDFDYCRWRGAVDYPVKADKICRQLFRLMP